MKPRLVLLVLALLMMGGCGKMDSVQTLVAQNYTDADGLIHAYPGDRDSEYLSESIGLYMEYLLLVQDEQTFSQQYDILKEHFLVQENEFHFIRWRLKENATVNALIDDIRILSALEGAAETFGNEEYRELSIMLSEAISSVQVQDTHTVDFYDWPLALPAQRMTLSYADDNQAITAESFELLENADDANVFFAEFYDTAANKYISGSEVHMIDQLLIAMNREKRGLHSEEFSKWLKKEWAMEQKLYGRYDRKTFRATVEYESLAVYYYLHAYFLALDETESADEVLLHANEIATEEMLSNAHFFDFIHYRLMLQNQ